VLPKHTFHAATAFSPGSLKSKDFGLLQQGEIRTGYISVCLVYIVWKKMGSCHKRQKPQAPTPQAPKVLTAILILPNLT